ncbi:MAG TPA: hypothetical protein VE733_09310 [Streptosporangiaceae bacterium]|jgi:hypothetical protein|nr:hypothetical protein [Streptosporangiaceae bacterium]
MRASLDGREGCTAAAVADANKEGGFFGLGARRRTDSEAAALEAVERATRLEDTERS